MKFRDDLQAAAQAAGEAVLPALVGIGTQGPVGSGFVIAEGRVLTSAHNLRPRARSLHFGDGSSADGGAATTDLGSDLAVLAAETGGVAPLAWAEEGPRIGELVFAAARPGGAGPLLSLGMVAALDQSFPGPAGRLIQGGFLHTAPLPHGASGGPVLNLEGRLIGINTRRMGEGFYAALGLGAQLRQRVERLIQGEVPTRSWLGVGLLPAVMAARLRQAVGLPERPGLLVREVIPEGPATAAGLRQGDLLVAAQGRPLGALDDLHSLLAELSVGTAVRLGVVRGAEELEVEVVVAAEPERQEWRGRPHGRRGPHSG